MIIIFQKFEKKNKFYQKIAKSGVIKKLITIPLNLKSMQNFSSKLGGGPGDSGAGKHSKT